MEKIKFIRLNIFFIIRNFTIIICLNDYLYNSSRELLSIELNPTKIQIEFENNYKNMLYLLVFIIIIFLLLTSFIFIIVYYGLSNIINNNNILQHRKKNYNSLISGLLYYFN